MITSKSNWQEKVSRSGSSSARLLASSLAASAALQQQLTKVPVHVGEGILLSLYY